MKLLYVMFLLSVSPTLLGQSLDEYVSEAMVSHPALRAARAAYESAVAQTRTKRAWLEPNMDFGVAPQPIQTRTGPQRAYISLNKPLKWPGLRQAEVAQSQWVAQMHYHKLSVVERQLRVDIKIAYYELFEVHAMAHIQVAHLALLGTYQKLLGRALANESTRLVDALHLRNQHKEAQIEHELIWQKKQNLVKNFNRLLDRPESDTVIVADTLALMKRDSLPKGVSFNHPSLRILEAAATSAHWADAAAAKQSYPGFEWGLQHSIMGQTNNQTPLANGQDAWLMRLRVKIPTAIRRYAAVRHSAQAEAQQWMAERKSLENQLLSQYEDARYQEKRAKEEMALHEYQINNLEQILRLLQASYRSDAQDIEGILRQTQQLLTHRRAWVASLVRGLKAQAKQEYIHPSN